MVIDGMFTLRNGYFTGYNKYKHSFYFMLKKLEISVC